MTSHTLPTSDTPERRRIKGPYSRDEVSYLKGHIEGCLRRLSDSGKKVNYEAVFLDISILPNYIYAPEWEKYWKSKILEITSITTRNKRNKYFMDSIKDAIIKGIFPTDSHSISGLTGSFSYKIQRIIDTCHGS